MLAKIERAGGALDPAALVDLSARVDSDVERLQALIFETAGETFNINADTAAGAIAGALGATRLLMLTDVPGVLDENKRLIEELTEGEARAGIASGMISGGMIPKVETCLEAVRAGAKAAVILDGRVPHACLLELFTAAGPGTLIRAE